MLEASHLYILKLLHTNDLFRNIHALDPYRMPSEGAWIRGQKIVEETIKQHLEQNEGAFPETSEFINIMCKCGKHA